MTHQWIDCTTYDTMKNHGLFKQAFVCSRCGMKVITSNVYEVENDKSQCQPKTEERGESMTSEERAAKLFAEHPLSYNVGRKHEDPQACVRVIANAIREAVAEEREACAKAAEATPAEGGYFSDADGGSFWESDAEATRTKIVAVIRARGEVSA